MIATFFKQSKPIVILFLGIFFSLCYIIGLLLSPEISLSISFVGFIVLKFVLLIATFFLFEIRIKHFEIQTGHCYVILFYVLLFCMLFVDVYHDSEVYAFVLLSFGISRLLNLSNGRNVKNSIFESVFLITLASFFYKPTIVFLVLLLVATLVFTKSKWRYYVIPILSVSCVVVLTQVYFLYYFDKPADFAFFFPALRKEFNFFTDNISVYMLVFYLISSLIFLYQIYSVKQVRSLYHRQMAGFFLAFFLLVLSTLIFEDVSISDLWLMSLWPFCIYLGDFISRIKKNLWLQISFWGFVLLSFGIYILRILKF